MTKRGARTRWTVGALVLLVCAVSTSTVASAEDGVEIISGVRYATHSGVKLFLDVYLPPDAGPFPAVIVIPGEQWRIIDRTKHSDVPGYFAEHGIAAFAIDYRSADDFPYPAAVGDVMTAIRWVRDHAAEYGVDPSRLGAIGVSAGGHLAALVATMGSGPTERGSRVNVVATWSGPMDLETLVDTPDEELRGAVRGFLGCSDTEPCSDIARRASPITYVDPSDPPMILVNSLEEVPADQAESMGAALSVAGVDAWVKILPDGHGSGYGGGTKVLDQVLPYLQAWIAGAPAPPIGSKAHDQEDPQEGGNGKVSQAESTPDASPRVDANEMDEQPIGVRQDANAVAVAIAMAALLAAAILLFVVVELRRRIAALRRDGTTPAPSVERT